MEGDNVAVLRMDIYPEKPEWGTPELIWTAWNIFLGELIDKGPNSMAQRETAVQEFWVPASRDGKFWRIDFDELKKRSFYQTREDFIRETNLDECRSNLQRLGSWFQRRRMSESSDAKMPETLEKLVSQTGGPDYRLVCPACPPVPENASGFGTNYVYEPSLVPLSKLDSKTVVAYCGSPAHKKKRDGRLVLFADGSARWVAEDVFANLLKESRRFGRDNDVTRRIRAGEKIELTAEEASEIRRAVAALGSDDWKERSAAKEKLLDIGARSYEILKEFENAEDLEIRKQIRELLDYFK